MEKMKKFIKPFVLIFITAVITFIGGTSGKSQCDHGFTSHPFKFVGSLLGFGSEKQPLIEVESHSFPVDEKSLPEDNKQVKGSHPPKTYTQQKILVTIVELGSDNCAPCKMMKPVMDQVKEKYSAQVNVVFYDVWTPQGRPYAQAFGIQAIPTQVFLDADNNEFFRHVGFFPFIDVERVLTKGGVKQ